MGPTTILDLLLPCVRREQVAEPFLQACEALVVVLPGLSEELEPLGRFRGCQDGIVIGRERVEEACGPRNGGQTPGDEARQAHKGIAGRKALVHGPQGSCWQVFKYCRYPHCSLERRQLQGWRRPARTYQQDPGPRLADRGRLPQYECSHRLEDVCHHAVSYHKRERESPGPSRRERFIPFVAPPGRPVYVRIDGRTCRPASAKAEHGYRR